jgi:hypothetical protein
VIRFARLGLLVIVMGALAVSGCGGIGPERTASGTTASTRLDASGVTRLDVAYGFDVHVSLGQPEAVTVTYDDSLSDLLDVGVDGPAQDPGLRLLVSGGSRVTADLVTDRADATVSGSSHLKLTGAAGTLAVDGSGSSDLELAELSLQHLDIQLSGASHANVQADKTIAAQLSGASGLTYTGTAQFTKQDTSGASTIQPA